MTPAELDTLATRRRDAVAEAERVHRELLDAVVAELERGADVEVKALAARAGISRATVYNELARRQTTRDALSPNGAPPPAPADTDVELSEAQATALAGIGAGTFNLIDDRRRRPTVEALRRRGLVKRDVIDLTELGRRVLAEQH